MGNKKSKGVAFREGNSLWYHRKKVLREDGTTMYTKKGGFHTPEEAEASYYKCAVEFDEACRKQQGKNRDLEITLKNYLVYWLEEFFGERVETTTRMLAAYTLYDLILPCQEDDIKLRYAGVDYFDTLLERVSKITPSSGNKARELLNLALNEAVEEGYIHNNPIPGTKTYKRQSPKIRVLSKEATKRFLKAASRENWYLEILLGLFVGLRKGEILGLKYRDWDEVERTISISRQITSNPVLKKGTSDIISYEVIEKPPKSKKSYRILRIPDVVNRELARRRKQTEENKEKLKELYRDGDYVSAQVNGLPHGVTSLNKALSKLCERNGLPHLTVHGLRHMYASLLIESNTAISLAKISALLGHESIHTTYEYYLESIDENDKIIAFLNDRFVPEGGDGYDKEGT